MDEEPPGNGNGNGDQPKKVLYLSGKPRSPDFEENLEPAPTAWPVHDRWARFANPAWMRGCLAAALITTLCVVAVVSLILIAFARDTDKVTRALALVFSALTGVTGAVSGFYFGGRGEGR